MAIVGANRGKFVVRTVREILVFNTCVDSSVLAFEERDPESATFSE